MRSEAVVSPNDCMCDFIRNCVSPPQFMKVVVALYLCQYTILQDKTLHSKLSTVGIPVISEFRRLRHCGHSKFKTNLGYIENILMDVTSGLQCAVFSLYSRMMAELM